MNIFSVNIRIYVSGLPVNESLTFANDTTIETMFSLIVIGVTEYGETIKSISNSTIPQNDICSKNNIRIRSEWWPQETNSSDIDDDTATCYFDITDTLLTNDSIYFQSLEITFDFIETHTNPNVTLSWAFGTFSYNLTERTFSASPTPSPTPDDIYSDGKSNILYYDDLIEQNMTYDGVYLFKVDGGFSVCDVNNSYMKITLGINETMYNESDVDIILLLADKNEFDGVYLLEDTISYNGEPSAYESFNNFSNTDWSAPHSHLTWFKSGVYWDVNGLKFSTTDDSLDAIEIYIEYYFVPRTSKTTINVNGTYYDVNTVEYEAVWYDYYDSNSTLTAYIALIDTSSDDVSYISEELYIEYVKFEFMSDDESLFDEDENYGQVKIYNSNFTCDDGTNITTCRDCMYKFDA